VPDENTGFIEKALAAEDLLHGAVEPAHQLSGGSVLGNFTQKVLVARCWPQLKKTRPQRKCYIVGRGATSAIRDLARRDPQIVVTGEVRDIRPYLARARVSICPVRIGSGFRAKILEAMASGVPVVSTSLGAEGIPSGSGETLLLADTPGQMLKCIRLLLTDASLCAAMAAKARELVINRFAPENGRAALNRVIGDVVAGRD
ncbi:MAG: glycosyltransferase, partial [Kiritimatiellia bacterium]|nr:glycosyltransferase [Kiritimatiellia bacterium]